MLCRKMTNVNIAIKKDTLYDHSIGVTFELRGLGNNHHSGIQEMLDRGMLPYIKNFTL